MSDTVIKVENVSKQYRLGYVGTGTLRDDLNSWWNGLMGKEDPLLKIGDANDRTQTSDSKFVWAIQDINFEVKQGEVLGIIGRNGAGKSTLLKILSKVTAPTLGRIKIKGRIASLLEVGTGFHPELTGRENIFLNGAILGMRRWEIYKKFDEIVSFAGVERYIDTPVKRYSSGMYVRLAFAVAAFLEPEILIVDEVLAVGDSEFQKKCIGRMKDVSVNDGRTVLFVSHNMAAVKTLCTRGIVLLNGGLKFEGTQIEAVQFYQTSHNTDSSFAHKGAIENAPGNDNIRILSFEVKPLKGDLLEISSGFTFELSFYNAKEGINLDATFELRSSEEVVIFHHGKVISDQKNSQRGVYTLKGTIPPDLINSGIYKFRLIFGENQRVPLLILDDFIQFEIQNETTGNNSSPLPGIIHPKINYEVTFNTE